MINWKKFWLVFASLIVGSVIFVGIIASVAMIVDRASRDENGNVIREEDKFLNKTWIVLRYNRGDSYQTSEILLENLADSSDREFFYPCNKEQTKLTAFDFIKFSQNDKFEARVECRLTIERLKGDD